MRCVRILIVVALAGGLLVQRAAAQQNLTFALFDRYLDALRQQAGIPGLSASIVSGQHIAWEKSYGFQNLDRQVPASPDTPYLVGDLTQTFTAALALQCMERRDLDLDEAVQRRAEFFPEPGTTVRQVLGHAVSAGTFRYDAARFAGLTPVISDCGDQPYPKALAQSILDRFAMFSSVPGQDLGEPTGDMRALFDQSHLDRYTNVLARLAVPYKVDRSGRATRSDYPLRGVNAATGLVSTARDLARWAAVLDDDILLSGETVTAAWTNAVSAGRALPTGIGWFVQSYNSQRVVWHFGLLPDAFSSLFVTLPDSRLTLILLANSDGLNQAAFPLARGDVTVNLFAQLFLRTFVP